MNLKGFVMSVQKSQESVGSFAKRHRQEYAQLSESQGCDIGPTARKTFFMAGLRDGAYHEVMAPWVNKILIGHGTLTLTDSTTSELQQAASDLLSLDPRYTRNNVLQAGRTPPTARAAGTNSTPGEPPGPISATATEMADRIRDGQFLHSGITDWLLATYTCP
jgi:hypothetical protein